MGNNVFIVKVYGDHWWTIGTKGIHLCFNPWLTPPIVVLFLDLKLLKISLLIHTCSICGLLGYIFSIGYSLRPTFFHLMDNTWHMLFGDDLDSPTSVGHDAYPWMKVP